MTTHFLDFERPIAEMEQKISELKRFSSSKEINISAEVDKIETKMKKVQKDILTKLTPMQRVQLSRHINRPYTEDYIKHIFKDFYELHGDRKYKDDRAIVGGIAKLNNETVVVIGHQKGRNTANKLLRNFGMAHPEGYRKALRLYELAERFKKPIITFIDTPGAYPGIASEERGIAEAIATNLQRMVELKVPIIAVVIGEGGSGGALGLGVSNRVLMLEYSTYSVISPEACSSILFKDGSKTEYVAEALKMAPHNLLKFGIIEEIIKEPKGGAHKDHLKAAQNLKKAIVKHLDELGKLSVADLLEDRYEKFRKIGKTK
ncbi:acetyl-CoA carboxylase carboxyltransferase subunit alpha [Thermodesulfobacteriota bacterium]